MEIVTGEMFGTFETLDLLDVSDWIGVEGPTFRTRTGEVTVQAQSRTLLATSLRVPGVPGLVVAADALVRDALLDD